MLPEKNCLLLMIAIQITDEEDEIGWSLSPSKTFTTSSV
jgi:hypothetical protein